MPGRPVDPAPNAGAAVAILAVDGGNSKTDVALVAADGSLLAALRGPTISHQAVGLERGMDVLGELVEAAAREAGLPPWGRPVAALGSYCLAGVDVPSDVRLLRAALARRRFAGADEVLNDAHAPLRAGTDGRWGVAIVCGAGMNGLGLAPDGRTARFAALGPISGDRGGGHGLGLDALGAAVRARDGRGPRTALERRVPEYFGFRRPLDVTRAIYQRTLPEQRLRELAPVVLATAADGDAVARAVVDGLADEVVAWAVAAIRRLRLTRREPPVVLSGGVFRTGDAGLIGRIRAGIRAVAPGARISVLDAPPVLGAALLGLDRLGTAGVAEARLRAALTNARMRGTGTGSGAGPYSDEVPDQTA